MANDEDWSLSVESTLHALGEPIEVAPTLLDRADGLAATEPAEGASGSDAAGPPVRATVRRYRPVETLGEGGMGVVKRCYDTDLMRELAVKWLRQELRESGRLQRQFLWEARVGAYLDHPNIVPVHDVGVSDDGGIFFTMKLVHGQSLEHMLAQLAEGDAEARKRFALPRRLRIFLQVAQALSFAHKRGVIHRDLKPSNIMVGDHGEVYVTDWGIAVPRPDTRVEHLERASPGTLGGPSGTPRYMSPEQAAGAPVDARSDVYALGAILYELVALQPAISGDTLDEVLDHVRSGSHAPLTEVAPEATASIVAVVELAMALDPDERYPTVASLAEDVERVVDGGTPEAEHASLLTRAGRFYMSPDRGLARLRVFDVDMMVFAGALLGVAAGLVLAKWLSVYVAAAFLLGASAVGVPPMLRWLRARREPAD